MLYVGSAYGSECMSGSTARVSCYVSLLTSCCDELLVVADGRVVDEGVGDHGGRLAVSIVCACYLCWYVADGRVGVVGDEWRWSVSSQ